MKLRALLLCLLLSILTLTAQESAGISKITLKNGTEFTGRIILRNDEIIMLKDNSGARFQIAVSEIDKIATVSVITGNLSAIGNDAINEEFVPNENFCGHLELSTSTATARKAFENNAATQASLVFGNKKAFGKDLFVGLGAGYLWVSESNLRLIPAILKIQANTSKNRTSPFVGFESGYAFAANKSYGGGPFAKAAVGVNYRISNKTAIFAGISAAIFSFSGQLSETTPNGVFAFDGTTSLNVFSLKAGLQF